MLAALSPARADAQDIVPSGPPTGSFTGVGTGWYMDVGQTFMAGGAYMNSFSFWFGPGFSFNYAGEGDPSSGALLVPYIMAWDGTNVVGSALFQGAATLVSGLSTYQRYDFATGDLALAPGTMYVAFVQAVDDDIHTGNVRVGRTAGTGAVATNVQGQPVQELTEDWYLANTGVALNFAADFSNAPVTATPEPATLMLLASGMAGLAGTRLRRKRRSHEDAAP
jgi:hypothetical protein